MCIIYIHNRSTLIVVDILAPISCQPYFHGSISRVEAEKLVVRDGEFLVRESTKERGQYILTGMAAGKKQHMLLIDKQGEVRNDLFLEFKLL